MQHRPWARTIGLTALALACGCSKSDGATSATGMTSGSGGQPAGAPSSSGGAAAGGPASGSSNGGQAGSAAGQSSMSGSSGSLGGGSGGAAGTGGAGANDSAPLLIYWIDVEGGAATLLIAPNGEVVVVDAGNPGARDAQRIADVLQGELQVDAIDHMIVTHYHGDHVGGLPVLAGLLPIKKYYDHGATVQPSGSFDDYLELAGDDRTLLEAGDVLSFGDLTLNFVTGAGKVIDPPLSGVLPNPLCPSNVTKDMDGGAENGQSLGFVARFGAFDFLDLGDLTWDIEQLLMCPSNRVGVVDLFQVNHHGQDFSNSPQLVHAVAPTVAVMNNGATKGGHVEVFETLQASPGLQDVWAVHEATQNDALHNAAPDLIANPAGNDAAHYLKAVIKADGSYTVTNGRNAFSRSYVSR
jgi:beta-lactamase superfamily II metal-dependent hydrolase